MIRKRYPNYKSSDIEWLGDVPEHWEVKRLKTSVNYWVSNVDKVSNETEFSIFLCNYTDVYYNDFISSDMNFMETTATKEEIKKFHLEVGDVIITKDSESWDDIAVSSLVVTTNPKLVCGYHLAMIRPKRGKILGEFLARQFQSSAINHQFQIAATGVTRYGLPKSAIGEAIVPLPPLSEQQAIAAFLDRETNRIDRLIDKKKKLIELLKEKRTAMISRAVTKGLDASVKYKASGVEWLGDVPEHWKVNRLKYQTSINDETLPEDTDPDFEILYVDIGSVGPTEGIVKKEKFLFEDAPSRARRIVKNGDSIVSTVRTYLRAIASIINPEDNLVVSTGFAVIRPKNIFARYLSYVLNAPYFIEEVVSRSVGVSYPAINASTIGEIFIPIPSFTEQQSISVFLDAETVKIDNLVYKVEAAIERLKEYRTALISSTVTGKFDVRDIQ